MATPPIVEYVQAHREELGDYEYLRQYEPDAEGVQFNDELPWQRPEMVYDDDVIWGGIAGERDLRSWLETDLMEGEITRADFERGFTREEFNDLQNYHGWNVYDTLALRATEGTSEIIPRQEYEFLSFCWAMERWPEFFRLIVDHVGIEGIIDLGRQSRDELGTGITPLLGWVYLGVPSGGAIGMQALDLVDQDDPLMVEDRKMNLTIGAALSYGTFGEEGYIEPSQNRYVNGAKSEDTVDFVTDHLVDLEGSTKATFRQFNAAVETLTFLMHYDNRVGFIDNGPYLVEDGKPMVFRDIHLNRPFLPWNDITASRDLPNVVTLALVIDPDAMDLQEIRVPLNVFTAPADYLSAVEQGAVFLRDEPDSPDGYPLSDLEVPDIEADLPDITARANEAVTDWYQRTAELPRRTKIENGAWTYYVGMLVPVLRRLGVYDYFEEELDLWEMPPMTSDIYHMMMDGVAQEEVPAMIMFGHGWEDFPEVPNETSGYADYLAEARDMKWKNQLSGLNEPPAGIADRLDEHGRLDVSHSKMEGDIPPTELGAHLESL